MTTKAQITGVAYSLLYDDLEKSLRERLRDDTLRGGLLWKTLKHNKALRDELFGCRPGTPENHFYKKLEQVDGSTPIPIPRTFRFNS